MYSSLSISVLLVILVVEPTYQQYCQNFPTNPGPNNFPTLPSAYQARVEVNYATEKRSSDMRVFYNYGSRLASVEIKENNSIKKLIFSYDTDEIYSLTCKCFFKNFTIFKF